MSNKKKGLGRDIIDKFYTKPSVAKMCFDKVIEYVKIDSSSDLLIEPSAGNGAFISYMSNSCDQVKFYDLKPEHPLIVEHDYLTLDCLEFDQPSIHVIGNPPFGRQSSLALKFIKKSAEFCDSISFILPLSSKKDSFKNKF